MNLLLGADLGTSGLKLVALDEGGRVHAEAEAGYEAAAPRPGWAETDVRAWRAAWDEATAALAPRLRGHEVVALGLSGQMHGAVLVDADGAALRPALLWPDRRATRELDRWRALPPEERAALANPLVPGMTGPLLAWLAAHEPETVAGATTVLLPKDALRVAVAGGPPVTDRSDASATLLWDVPADGWSAAATAAAGVDPGLLPDVRLADEVVGTTALAGAEVPVVVGGADTPLALLAAGTTAGAQVNLGTGAQLLRPGWTPAPADDPVVHGYAQVLDGWYAMAALQNGGSAWAWVRRVLGLSWDEFFAAAEGSGSGRAVFRPFLTGERGGVAGPEDRGGWSGLEEGTTRAELVRAAVEGVVLAVAEALQLLDVPDDGAPLVLTGGGGRAPVVRQLLADATGRPVRWAPVRSASAVGAALLAARGTGADVVPEREAGAVVEPSGDRRLDEVRARWRASGTGAARAPSTR